MSSTTDVYPLIEYSTMHAALPVPPSMFDVVELELAHGVVHHHVGERISIRDIRVRRLSRTR